MWINLSFVAHIEENMSYKMDVNQQKETAMFTIYENVERLQQLADHFRELATAQWVAGDYVGEGKYNARATEVEYAISHLGDAIKIV